MASAQRTRHALWRKKWMRCDPSGNLNQRGHLIMMARQGSKGTEHLHSASHAPH